MIRIHNNPVHHRFCDHAEDYPWSSYTVVIAVKPTKLKKDVVMGWFDDLGNFKYLHNQKIEVARIKSFLKL